MKGENRRGRDRKMNKDHEYGDDNEKKRRGNKMKIEEGKVYHRRNHAHHVYIALLE